MTAGRGPTLRALLGSEVRRALARRATRALVLVALVGTTVFGVAVFVNTDEAAGSSGAQARFEQDLADCLARPGVIEPGAAEDAPSAARLSRCTDLLPPPEYYGAPDPARITDLWDASGGGDSILLVAATFLMMGAVIGGGSMVGADIEARSFAVLLTWEPRRRRVLGARLAASGALAAVIAMTLAVSWCAAYLPTPLVKGTTVGADAAFWWDLGAAVGRIGTLAAVAAVIAGALAAMGRRTSVALGAGFLAVSVVEPIVRAVWPRYQPWLLADNIGNFLTASSTDGTLGRSTLASLLTLVLYAGIVVAASLAVTARRDVVA